VFYRPTSQTNSLFWSFIDGYFYTFLNIYWIYKHNLIHIIVNRSIIRRIWSYWTWHSSLPSLRELHYLFIIEFRFLLKAFSQMKMIEYLRRVRIFSRRFLLLLLELYLVSSILEGRIFGLFIEVIKAFLLQKCCVGSNLMNQYCCFFTWCYSFSSLKF